MRRSLLLVPTVLLATLLSTVASARAEVVLNQGMAGVKVRMTDSAARKILGSPTKTRRVKNANGQRELQRYFKRSRVSYVATRSGGSYRVLRISTRSKKQRTGKGVGVGSREKTLRRKHAGISCTSYPSTSGRRVRECFTQLTGETQTIFRVSLKTRRITFIRVNRFPGGFDE